MTNEASFDFSGTTVLVTGGTSGIGHGIATAFRNAGATVSVTGTRDSSSDYDVDLTEMLYHRLVATNPATVESVATSTRETMKHLDVLVNNAGATFPNGLDEYTPDGFDAAVAVNLLAPYRLTHALYGPLTASVAPGGPSVISIVSMAAFRAVPLVPGYGSSKAGLVQATRNLAVRWAPKGIRVNAVAPGHIDTPMTAPAQEVPGILEEQLAHIPQSRFGTVNEVAPAVLFLASRQAAYITGTVLPVDGGFLAI